MSVLQPAELRALAAIDAGTIRADRQFVAAARDEVLLARETRNPERVNDVHALELRSARCGRPEYEFRLQT